jgi:hypothetical protein
MVFEKSISNIIKLEELFDDQTNMVNTMSNIYKDAAKKTFVEDNLEMYL